MTLWTGRIVNLEPEEGHALDETADRDLQWALVFQNL